MTPPARPTPVLLETDFFSDVDDVGALALLLDHVERGDARLLAVGVNTPSVWGVPAVRVVLEHYGVSSPVGSFAWSDDELSDPDYARQLVEIFGGTALPVSPAVEVHRAALAAAEDHSVVVISIGFFGNLNALLASGADELSQLTGVELVRRKVRRTVAMAGWFPSGREFNIFSEVEGSTEFLANWPLPIDFVGFEVGEGVITGSWASAMASSPVASAYAWYCEPGEGRPSWDLLAVHAALVEPSTLVRWSSRGRMSVADDGENTWLSSDDGPHRYALLTAEPAEAAAVLDEQLRDVALREPAPSGDGALI